MTRENAELDKFEQASKAIRRSVPALVATIESRYRKELPAVGGDIAGLSDASIADHMVTLIAEIATMLNSMHVASVEQRDMLLADGRTLYSVLGELHGTQRRKFNWSEEAIFLEYRILLEELTKTAGKGSISGSEERDVSEEIGRIVVDAREHSLKTYRTPQKATSR